MHTGSVTRRAVTAALVVFVGLTSLFFYGWRFEDLPWLHSERTLILSILLLIAFFTVIVYQSIRITVSAQYLAEDIAKDMALYSRELSTQLYRGSPVPYVLVDAEFRIVSLNTAAFRLFHTEEGRFCGKEFLSLLVEDESSQKASLVPEYFRRGVPVNDMEVEVMRTDGATRWVRLSLFSFKDTEGARRGLVTLVDITKQKEVDRAKTEFVSLASHQLRTPISAMKWNLELLLQARGPEVTEAEKVYFDKLVRGAIRMETLIDDFLNVSKLELGTLTPTYEEVDFRDFLASVMEEHEKQAEARRITIENEYGEGITEPCPVRTDTHLLNMAVSNLVSNAVKYTPDGGMVRVRSHLEARTLIVTVSDTGIGIPEEEQERVFSKIFRAANAKVQVQEGTGLGLYIVREALKIIGGTISFTSKENAGTTFTIVLPNV